jgi:hypothetical protein
MEDAALQPSPGKRGKEALDRICPGTGGGRENSADIGNSKSSLRKSRVEKNRTYRFSTSPVSGLRRDDLVPKLLCFLFGIRRAFVDMQNVCVAIVLEG